MLSDALRNQISDLVANHPVVLFMKGNRQGPQCGFSAQVVQILDALLPEYETVDVLSSPELRDGIKEFSEWPTIPQLFINGTFVGGCDIVRELNQNGELQALLSGPGGQAVPAPTITITADALRAFQLALAEAEGDVLHLKIDPKFAYDLFFGPPEPGEIQVLASGFPLLLDPGSARRAEGVSIDFVDGPNPGFKIGNPNEPAKVKQLTAPELKAMLDTGKVQLFDVRPDAERALASIKEARSLDEAGQEYLLGLDHNTPIAFHCHHGMRSQAAAVELLGEGFRNVYNLSGGIEAWSSLVDPTVPHY